MRAGLPRGRQPPCLYPGCSRGMGHLLCAPALAHQLTCCVFSRHDSPSLSVGGWGSRGVAGGSCWDFSLLLPGSRGVLCHQVSAYGLDSVQRHLYQVCGQGPFSWGSRMETTWYQPRVLSQVRPPTTQGQAEHYQMVPDSSTMGCLHLRDYLH